MIFCTSICLVKARQLMLKHWRCGDIPGSVRVAPLLIKQKLITYSIDRQYSSEPEVE